MISHSVLTYNKGPEGLCKDRPPNTKDSRIPYTSYSVAQVSSFDLLYFRHLKTYGELLNSSKNS